MPGCTAGLTLPKEAEVEPKQAALGAQQGSISHRVPLAIVSHWGVGPAGRSCCFDALPAVAFHVFALPAAASASGTGMGTAGEGEQSIPSASTLPRFCIPQRI